MVKSHTVGKETSRCSNARECCLRREEGKVTVMGGEVRSSTRMVVSSLERSVGVASMRGLAVGVGRGDVGGESALSHENR